MPQNEQGLISAPVFRGFETAQFSFSAHGTVPSVIAVRVAPADFRPRSTPFTVALTYANITRTFPDCILDKGVWSYSAGGNRMDVRILDHRWRWQFAQKPLTKHVNRRIGRKIREGTRMTSRELARLLLEAAGEANFDIEKIPEEDYPEVEILGIKPPMVELEALVSRYGLRVCYVPQSRLVRIVRPGEGALLPVNDYLAFPSTGVDPPERPNKLHIVGGPVQVWTRWKLIPVGQETEEEDSKIIPIDDLSYTPDDGWQTQYPESMTGVSGEEERRLALKTVYRWYRIDRSEDTPDEIDGEANPAIAWFLLALDDPSGDPLYLSKLEQILPVKDTIPEIETAADGSERFKKAIIRGDWYEGQIDTRTENQNADDGTYQGGWSLDRENGIVMFTDPVYLFDREDEVDGPIKPAELTIELTCQIRPKANEPPLRPVYVQNVSRQGGGIKLLSRRDLERVIKFLDGELDDGVEDFEGDAAPVAEEYLSSLQTDKTAVGLYNRVEPMDPDGAIQQLSYAVGVGGATTTISRNAESSDVSPDYIVRRRVAQQNAELEANQ